LETFFPLSLLVAVGIGQPERGERGNRGSLTALSFFFRCAQCVHAFLNTVKGKIAMNQIEQSSVDTDTVHAFYCSNPLCSETIKPTRRWQKFCSSRCRQQASLIHRAAVLLSGLPDSAVIAILRSEQEITQIGVQLSPEQRTKCGGTAGK
jgi:hypothetical protein